jgi:outer membrane protein OmpA-like peptidoglycan-associated protein/tetratricopeptide (TPR) repeat protein
MIKFILYFPVFLLFFSCKSSNSLAQNNTINAKAEKLYNEGVTLLFSKNIELAVQKLEAALKEEPNYFQAHFKLAEVYQSYLKNYPKAIEVYDAINTYEKDNQLVNYNQAFCYFYVKDYIKAKQKMDLFLTSEYATGKTKQNAQQLLSNVQFSEQNDKNIVAVNFVNMGNAINSDQDEYFPSVTADNGTMYFTVNDRLDSYPNEDIYYATYANNQWTTRKAVNSNINSPVNDGAHCIATNGNYLLFASENYKYGNQGKFDIYLSKKEGNEWKIPINLGVNINTRYWDSQPVLSADGKMLLFVSTQPKSIGGSDIFYSILDSTGKFGPAQNIGNTINTPFDEQRPYLHPDGKTLYFASAGHPGFGGTDLFKSTLNIDGTWSKPINLGLPINSVEDEMGIFVSADGQMAYISSDRVGGLGGQDIYQINLPNALQPNLVSYLKGTILANTTNRPITAKLKIVDLETGNLVHSIQSDKINGSFLCTILGEKNYGVTAQADGFLPFSENIALKHLKENEAFIYDIRLQPIQVGERFTFKNIYFENNSYQLLDMSKTELAILIELLKTNPIIKIAIEGHTDNVGNSAANLVLSENRAKTVKNYLVANDIAESRLQTKGYGDTQAIAPNDSEQNKAKNRRTSFLLIP